MAKKDNPAPKKWKYTPEGKISIALDRCEWMLVIQKLDSGPICEKVINEFVKGGG